MVGQRFRMIGRSKCEVVDVRSQDGRESRFDIIGK
jgi:hypothetical protein